MESDLPRRALEERSECIAVLTDAAQLIDDMEIRTASVGDWGKEVRKRISAVLAKFYAQSPTSKPDG